MDSNSLTGRWQGLDFIIFYIYENQPEFFRELAKSLTDSSNDPYFIAQVFADYFLSNGLYSPEMYDSAATVLKWEVPQNYFDSGDWNLEWDTVPIQIALLIRHFARLPEFQMQ